MAQQTLYTMESAQMRCGDVGGGPGVPGEMTHLTIQEMKLPALEEAFVDHTPGGAIAGTEIMMVINKLEATFNLAGWQPRIMRLFGTANRSNQRFEAIGLIRDRRTGVALKGQAIIEGRLGRVNPTNFAKGNLMAHEYSIRGIISYKLSMQEDPNSTRMEPIYEWDFFTSEFWVGENDVNSDLKRILLGGAA